MIVPGPASQAAEASAPSNQSARSIADGEAPMGVATTRSMERVAAALGALEGAETRFERADDVAHGGVLCALAALLTFGLLRHAQSHFSAPRGFYPMESIFLLLAYLALGRVPSLEQLRYHSPGEWNPGEFIPKTLTHPNGEKSTLQLAERGTRLTNGLWVREIRALSETGHQTAILSTDYRSELARSAATMFDRWNQENFFKYMREHYGLYRLVEHGIRPVASLCSPLRGCLSAGCLAALGS